MDREALVERIRAGVLGVCQDAVGILLFGSFARGEPAHDLDVLVVVRDPGWSEQERWTRVIDVRRSVGLLRLDVDVLIYTEEEFRAGLMARFPLLLDVAFDGQVIHGDGELSSLLQQIRRDVAVRGIQRTETGGWRFPVRYRERTPLSGAGILAWKEIGSCCL